jgi:hypothetical protein
VKILGRSDRVESRTVSGTGNGRANCSVEPPEFVREPDLHSPVYFRETLADGLWRAATRFLPHNTRKTTCPPAPLVAGGGPVIIVPSLMRSGTHLLLDTLFNNFPALRRRPLFVDFDAYERAGLPPEPLASISGVTIKTHHPRVELSEPCLSALESLAGRALILTPRRPAEEVCASLAKWGHSLTVDEFGEIERRFDAFWGPYSPVAVSFPTLLDAGGAESLIKLVAERTGLAPVRRPRPVMPAGHRLGVYFDKVLTRLLGRGAPRINTTIGYRLAPKPRAYAVSGTSRFFAPENSPPTRR